MDVAKAGYDQYMMNGLMTQLTRLKLGDKIEEAHMRNRQLNAKWVYEKGKAENVVEFVKQNGKTFVRTTIINNYACCLGNCSKKFNASKAKATLPQGKH
jgi:dipeptidyl-peptidase III